MPVAAVTAKLIRRVMVPQISTAAAIHCNESLYASRRCSRTAARNTRAS